MARTLQATMLAAALVMLPLVRGGAGAADRQVLGKRLDVRDPTGSEPNRSVLALGRERPTDVPAVAGDPTSAGATLRVIAEGGTGSDETYVLDASGWRAIGHGYRYRGPSGADGDPVRSLIVKRTPAGAFLLRLLIRGAVGTQDVNVVPPNPGEAAGIVLDVAGGDRYCVRFGGPAGGTETHDDASRWRVKNAVAEPGCPTPPTTTSTSTSTTTSTSTSTTTSTETSTTTAVTTTSTSTSTTTTIACLGSEYPECGGSCPSGQVCAPQHYLDGSFDFPYCLCVDEANACGVAAPLCEGVCPPGNTCEQSPSFPCGRCVLQPTRCCQISYSDPNDACFDALEADAVFKCTYWGEPVATLAPPGAVCDGMTGTCGAVKSPGAFCCECPAPAEFPHSTYCFDSADPHALYVCRLAGCVDHAGLACGEVTERCGGSPSGAFVGPVR